MMATTGLQQQPNMFRNNMMLGRPLHQQPTMAGSNRLMPGAGGGSLHNFLGDRSMLTMSDDTVMMKQIQETHAPDGREVDVNYLLFLVEDIFQQANINLDPITHEVIVLNLRILDKTLFTS